MMTVRLDYIIIETISYDKMQIDALQQVNNLSIDHAGKVVRESTVLYLSMAMNHKKSSVSHGYYIELLWNGLHCEEHTCWSVWFCFTKLPDDIDAKTCLVSVKGFSLN